MRAEHCSQGFHRRPNSRRVYRTTGQMRGSCRLLGLVGTHHDHLRHQIRYDKLLIALRVGGARRRRRVSSGGPTAGDFRSCPRTGVEVIAG